MIEVDLQDSDDPIGDLKKEVLLLRKVCDVRYREILREQMRADEAFKQLAESTKTLKRVVKERDRWKAKYEKCKNSR